jgi:DNA-binding beta-propeller fold protein YncE
LKVMQRIELSGVNGRIDHLDYNLKDQLVYAAALGNNSLEIADINTGLVVHSIKGLDEPQGVAYIPQHNEIFVANGGNGMCEFYDAKSYKRTASVKLSSDADDVRYDSLARMIYVGYGTGGIAIIDADSHRQIGDIKLPAHPESFQLDKSINRLFVNVPDAGTIAVIDIKEQKLIEKWKNDGNANFPMTIDTSNHKVFVGYRRPAQFIVLDGRTGQSLGSYSMVSDADDMYFDENYKLLLVSGGGGYINIFKEGIGGFKQLANISGRTGARTSLLIPQLHLFILAERANGKKEAELLVYKIIE